MAFRLRVHYASESRLETGDWRLETGDWRWFAVRFRMPHTRANANTIVYFVRKKFISAKLWVNSVANSEMAREYILRISERRRIINVMNF